MPDHPRVGRRTGILARTRSLLRLPPNTAWDVDALLRCGADALVMGCSEASSENRPALLERARILLGSATRTPGTPARFLGLDLASTAIDADLDMLMPGRPDGVVLSPCRSPAAVQRLGAKLAVMEAEHGLLYGSTAILAVAGGTASGLMNLAGYGTASRRLTALLWDAASLAADLGADASLADIDDGRGALGSGRAMTLLAARAAGLVPIDTAVDEEDLDRLAASCRQARRMGFTGKVAASARQVATINACFSHAPE